MAWLHPLEVWSSGFSRGEKDVQNKRRFDVHFACMGCSTREANKKRKKIMAHQA